MRAKFTKFNDVVSLLKEGWEIYTRRGSAPYSPLYYHLYKGEESRRVHINTIKKLINEGIITGNDLEPGKKYKLI